LISPLCLCSRVFNATDFADNPTPGSTVFSGYLDKATNTFYWNFNFTNPGVVGLQALEIRDGKKDMDVLGSKLMGNKFSALD
jgi:hypothetical protein